MSKRDEPDRFAEMVRLYLAANRINHKVAAKEIGISESTLSRFLSGRGMPDYKASLEIIAWVFS
jgi:transcriptional regulator with XRE-family HTH domain